MGVLTCEACALEMIQHHKDKRESEAWLECTHLFLPHYLSFCESTNNHAE